MTALNNIETNEINKKRKTYLTHDMLHIDQILKCEYSSSNFNFIVSFQYREIKEQFLQHLSDNLNFPAYAVVLLHAILTSCTCHANG